MLLFGAVQVKATSLDVSKNLLNQDTKHEMERKAKCKIDEVEILELTLDISTNLSFIDEKPKDKRGQVTAQDY